MTTLANMITTYTISAVEMKTALKSAGIRANAVLAALAPREASPNAVPVLESAYNGVYTLSTAAHVKAVIDAGGPRGHGFMEALYALRAA
jgi:hypothetical protein